VAQNIHIISKNFRFNTSCTRISRILVHLVLKRNFGPASDLGLVPKVTSRISRILVHTHTGLVES